MQPAPQPLASAPAPAPGSVLVPAAPVCQAANWSARTLPPLLGPGKTPSPAHLDQFSARVRAFDAECGDAPDGPRAGEGGATVLDGVEVSVKSALAAGSSGRHWQGNQCVFDLRLVGGAGRPVELGADVVPPFNAITALVRAGSAAWLELSYNGYTREFPKGGNRVVAVDLCEGRVVWSSKSSTSNGGLLLLGDYLIAAFGFTSERRSVNVLSARTGALVQKLPVVENICPSKAWAPNWDGGRCDAPGQAVGAATSPRVEAGLLLVDTNTGSAALQFR